MRNVIPDLAAYTTLRLGGPAARVVEAVDDRQIQQIVRDATEPLLVLAGGSNVLVGDEGFPGTVLLLRTTGVHARRDGDGVALTVAAGEPWDAVVTRAIEEGWSGLECLSGIPGSTGATPIQNVGAYGREVAEVITGVRVLDRLTGDVRDWSPDECGFGYRASAFKYSERYLVLSVDFRLPMSKRSAPIRYPELAAALDVAPGSSADASAVRAAVLGLRTGKGMVLDPDDHDTWSAGSFFTNPVMPAAAFAQLQARADSAPPAYPAGDGTVKTSAAWLIDRAGFTKGYGHGRVGISSKHSLALTNRGGGTTAELLALAREIRDGVEARFGVALHPEPVLVGCAL